MSTTGRPEAMARADEPHRIIGTRFPRLEDERLLRGRARYVADLRLPGMVDVAIVRSQVAHGYLRNVDVAAARAAEGVIDVVTAADVADVNHVPDFPLFAKPVATRLFATDRVRYVGRPIAAVVADDRYLAEDAAELVEVDIEALPAMPTVAAALADGAMPLFDDWADNRILDFQMPNPAVDEPFSRLRVFKGSYYIHRHSPCRWSAAAQSRSTGTGG